MQTPTERKLAAIMIADVVGFSALMERNETRTFERVRTLRESLTNPAISKHGGRVIKTTGDGFLAEFTSATAALKCGIEIQRLNLEQEGSKEELDRLHLRIGINLGDIIIDGDDVAGDGVNIAARLEPLAPKDGICVSGMIREQVREDLGVEYEDLGEQKLKNISRLVRAFAVNVGGDVVQSNAAPVVSQSQVGVRPPSKALEIDLSLPDKPSIAVLPFTNMSDDPEQEYFTDGVSEDIITELSRFRSLFVIARNSTFTYKGKAVDVRTVAKELGVRYVLEGSIRRAGDRIRITGQLIDALTGNHIWAERFDRVLEDVFEVQEEVTRNIVAAIAPQIDAAEKDYAQRRRPENLSAYEIAVRANTMAWKAHQNQDRSMCDQAISKAKAALIIDPRSALALNTLAYAQFQHVFYRTAADLDAAWHEGIAASSKAIEVDPSDGRAYAYRGSLFGIATKGDRWDEALRDLRRAYQLNPNDLFTLNGLGYMESATGNPEGGLEYLHQSLRINPRDPNIYRAYTFVATAHFLARNYAKAIEYAMLGTGEAPRSAPQYMILVGSYVGLGDLGNATAVLEKVQRLAPELVKGRLNGQSPPPFRKPEDRQRMSTFLRVAAGMEDPSAADAFR